jgi:hypothetical protein
MTRSDSKSRDMRFLSSAFCARKRKSNNRFGTHDADPDHEKSHDHAKNNIEQASRQLAILNRPKRFIFERGKSCVSTNEANGNKVTPGWTQAGFFRKDRHRRTDQKATAHIYQECPVRKAGACFLPNVRRKPEAGYGTQKTANSNNQVLFHQLSLSIPYACLTTAGATQQALPISEIRAKHTRNTKPSARLRGHRTKLCLGSLPGVTPTGDPVRSHHLPAERRAAVSGELLHRVTSLSLIYDAIRRRRKSRKVSKHLHRW